MNLNVYSLLKCFPGGSDGKVSVCNAGDLGLIPGWGRFPWRRKWQPTPVFLPGESNGRKSLVGYSPWGRKESDMTEQLHFTFSKNHCCCSVAKSCLTLMTPWTVACQASLTMEFSRQEYWSGLPFPLSRGSS